MRIVKHLLNLPTNIWLMFIGQMPGSAGRKLRYVFYRKRLNFLGRNAVIGEGVHFVNPEYISIDDNAWIDTGVIILAGPARGDRPTKILQNDKFPLPKGRVYIGKRVHVAPYCVISGHGGVYVSDDCGIAAGGRVYSLSHHYRSEDAPTNRNIVFSPLADPEMQYMVEGPIVLETNVGVALNAVVLPGVTIGQDSFVLTGSVVAASFEENSLIAGNPAKRLKNRFEDEQPADSPVQSSAL